jgi:hypothetical protein
VGQPQSTQRYLPTQATDEDALTRAIVTLSAAAGAIRHTAAACRHRVHAERLAEGAAVLGADRKRQGQGQHVRGGVIAARHGGQQWAVTTGDPASPKGGLWGTPPAFLKVRLCGIFTVHIPSGNGDYWPVFAVYRYLR